MTDPTTTIPSDLRTHRHPIQIDDDGRLFALEITGGRLQPRGVILMSREGGIVMVPELTIEQLQRPTADEPGASRLAAALKRLGALEIGDIDGDSATPMDRLEAAIDEYVYYLHNVKPDLEGWHKDIQEAEEERRKIRAVAIDVITSGDPSKDTGGDALDLVRHLCQYTEAWRDGAAALAREGLLEVGAAMGPGEFYARLRAAISLMIERRRQIGEDYVEARKMLDRVAELIGCDQKREDLIGCVRELLRKHGELEAEVARLRESAGKRLVIAGVPISIEGAIAGDGIEIPATPETRHLFGDGVQVTAAPPIDPAIAALDDFKAKRADDLLQVRGIATDAALMVLDTLTPRAEGQPPHAVRVHMPGAGLLRVIVAADVTDDVLAELEAEVDDKVAERATSISIEREPGGLPEGQGYEIKEGVDSNGEPGDGVHPGSAPTEEWMVYHWENAELDDAGQGRKSKAEAIDDVWVDYAVMVLDAAEPRGEGEDA